ncbi:periodic tryptophan protein 1 homolog, partial [Parasteatoda tepidariorum]|uniref:periodic tryptophan protein 1 homolog n=1 Tax=Parasteatoda tepidariorum TaxID=114398 RepID=UPI001C721DAB
MNFVPCLTWVAKGIAKSVPDKLQLSPEELKSLISDTKELQRKVEDDDASESDATCDEHEDIAEETETLNDEEDKVEKEEEDFDKRYNLDSYDNDGEDQPFMNISDVATFIDNKEDTYITDHDAVEEDENDDEEDFIIKDSDNLLLVGHIEEESSVLEVHVYNKEEDAFYVHHDIVLPAYPLALEWLDFSPSDEEKGNYVAVADMTPVIKIWDLDVVEILEPDYCLGKELKENKMEKIKRKYHSDAVISLCWNKHTRNILASGSADSSIILWDLQEGKPLKKLDLHDNKVQSLQWHPFETSFLLSGSTDGVVKLFDCRTPDAECKSWTFDGEIEKVAWNLSNPLKFLCSNDQGFVHSVDIQSNKVEHSFKAHADAVTGLEMCPMHPNILVTASMDKTIKIWDLVKLSHVETRKLKVGSIYTAKFAPDAESVLAIGGNDRSHPLKILDLQHISNSEVNVEKKNHQQKQPAADTNTSMKKVKKSIKSDRDTKQNSKIKYDEGSSADHPVKKLKK